MYYFLFLLYNVCGQYLSFCFTYLSQLCSLLVEALWFVPVPLAISTYFVNVMDLTYGKSSFACRKLNIFPRVYTKLSEN